MSSSNHSKGRIKTSIATPLYNNAFIAATWGRRNQMQDYERRGFFNFIHLTLCTHVESLIARFLRAALQSPIVRIELADDRTRRRNKVSGGDMENPLDADKQTILSVLKDLRARLERTSFDLIQRSHGLILGSTLQETLGQQLHDDVLGLMAFRNLIAHGRDLAVEQEFKVIPVKQHAEFVEVRPDWESFEVVTTDHPLMRAYKSLKQAKLLPATNNSKIKASELMDVFYGDDAVLHFHRAATATEMVYHRLAALRNLDYFKMSTVSLPALTK